MLLGFYYDAAQDEYVFDTLDQGRGAANCLLFERDGHPALLSSNRETDEIAIYDILE